jgi:stress response protein YsnF
LEEDKTVKPKRQKRKRASKSRGSRIPEGTTTDAIIPSAISVEPSSPPASFTSYETLPVEMVVTPGEIVVKPDLPKTLVTIIRPRSIQKQESITGKVTEVVESVKDKTEEVIDTLASTTGIGVKRTVSEINSEPLIIPLIEQQTSTKLKTYTETVRIEKRLVEKKKTLDIPINYEEIFVNGRQIEPSVADTFKDIKDKILDIVSVDQDKGDNEKENVPGEKIPLFGNDSEIEKVIPIYAEEVVVSKRLVEVAEVRIRKRKVTQVKKVDVGNLTEELTVQNPNGNKSFYEEEIK